MPTQVGMLTIRKLEKFVNTAARYWVTITAIFVTFGVMIVLLRNSYPWNEIEMSENKEHDIEIERSSYYEYHSFTVLPLPILQDLSSWTWFGH